MRTNIDLDDALLREARKYSDRTTKRALVEEALETFVRIKADARRREAYEKRLGRLQGDLSGLRLRRRPSDILHEDRSR